MNAAERAKPDGAKDAVHASSPGAEGQAAGGRDLNGRGRIGVGVACQGGRHRGGANPFVLTLGGVSWACHDVFRGVA